MARSTASPTTPPSPRSASIAHGSKRAAPDKLSFGWERLEFLLKEPNLRDLLTAYWQELSVIKHLPLDIDWAHFLEQERAGIYRIWTARVNGTFAGFVSFYVKTHPYYRSVLMAVDGVKK